MARHFTREEIEEIRRQLGTSAVRDSDFPVADTVLDDDEVAIIQNDTNKRLSVPVLEEHIREPFREDERIRQANEVERKKAEGQFGADDPDYANSRIKKEQERRSAETARNEAENGPDGRVAKENERRATEGTSADEPGAETRWGAEKQRQINEESRIATEGRMQGLIDNIVVNFLADTDVYEQAVEQGYEGTREEWLASTLGVKGLGIDTWVIDQSTADSGLTTHTITLNDSDRPGGPTIYTFTVKNGKGISSINLVGEYNPASYGDNTYRINYSDGTHHDYQVKNGNGIASITPVSISTENGGSSVYRITFNNGGTFEYSIRNGKSSAGFFATATALNTAISSPNAGDYAFVSKAGDGTWPAYVYICSTDGTWTATENEFTPDDPTDVLDVLNSTSTTAALSAKQGKVLNDSISQLGQEVHADIVDKTNAFTNASSLIDNWHVDGTDITFVQSDGMNGTFTSHTSPGKPTTTRPYFMFQGFEAGKKYHLKMKVVVNSSTASDIGLFYGAYQTESWSTSKLIDIDGNVIRSLSGIVDCIFEAVSGRTYLGFSADALGIDDTVTISEFAIDSVKDIDDINDEVEQLGPRLLNNYLVGDGNTFVTRSEQGLVPGRTYRIILKNPNWDLTGVTIDTKYHFTIVSSYNGVDTILAATKLTETMPTYYEITIPENSDYVRFGGRAAVGARMEYYIEDYTDSFPKPYYVGWPKCYTKNDAFSVVTTENGKNYGYIFPLSDESYLYAVAPSGYEVLSAIYNTYDDAVNKRNLVAFCGNGYSPYTMTQNFYSVRVGTTVESTGFLVIWVERTDQAVLTDADKIAIGAGITIEIYAKSTLVQIRENANKSRLSNGLSVGLECLWPYICNNAGSATDSERLKFFDFNFIGNKEIAISVDVSGISIENLQYGMGIWQTIVGAQSNLSGQRLELYSATWQTENVDDWIPEHSGVFNLYFRKSDNSLLTNEEIASIRSNLVVTLKRVHTEEVQSINYIIYSVNHRGYSAIAPENTLPAFILSRKKGFNYVETDVAFTSDDVPVLMHDSTINRTARNEDGTQLSSTIYIYDITYAQALQYDYGIWKGAEWAGTPIPTFLQFIQLCKELSIHPFIELKDSITWTQEKCERIAADINAVGMEKNVSFISFSKDALSFMKVLFPEATLGLATHAATYDTSSIGALLTDATELRTSTNKVIVSLDYTRMTDALYAQVAAAGINSLVWTVNDEADAKNLDENTIGVLSDYINAGALIMKELIASLPDGV